MERTVTTLEERKTSLANAFVTSANFFFANASRDEDRQRVVLHMLKTLCDFTSQFSFNIGCDPNLKECPDGCCVPINENCPGPN